MTFLKMKKKCKFLERLLKVLCNLVYISFPLSVFSILVLSCFGNDHLHVFSSGIIGQKSIAD